jgi:hypothetical protein
MHVLFTLYAGMSSAEDCEKSPALSAYCILIVDRARARTDSAVLTLKSEHIQRILGLGAIDRSSFFAFPRSYYNTSSSAFVFEFELTNRFGVDMFLSAQEEHVTQPQP